MELQQEPLSPAQRLVHALHQVAEGFKLVGSGVGELGSIVSEVHKGWSESRAARLRAMNAKAPVDAGSGGHAYDDGAGANSWQEDNLNKVPFRT